MRPLPGKDVAVGEECAVEAWVSVGGRAADLEEALVAASGVAPAEEEGRAADLEEGPVAASAAVEEAGQPAVGVAIALR